MSSSKDVDDLKEEARSHAACAALTWCRVHLCFALQFRGSRVADLLGQAC